AHPRRQRATPQRRGRLPDAAADRARIPRAQRHGLVAARRRAHEGPYGMSVVALIEYGPAGTAIGHRLVDATAPVLRVDDLGVTRGDGVFETASLVDGHVQALEAHLSRLAQSAAMLELPLPELPVWRDAVHAVAATLTSQRITHGSVKFVLTRGVEGTG